MSQAKVFFIIESEDYDDVPYGFAFSDPSISPKEIKKVDKDLWKPIEMELRDGEFADFLVNDLDIPLFSEKLKNLTDSFVIDSDYISWFPIIVKNTRQINTYYFCKINTYCECIDFDKSFKDGEMIKIPYFIKDKIKNIFRMQIDSDYLFVSEDLKKAIIDNQITGLDFAKWDEIVSDEPIKLKEEDKIINQSYKTHEGKEYTQEKWEKFKEEQKKNRPPGTSWSLLDDED